MKNLIKTTTFAIAAILLVSTTSFAFGTKEKAIEKATEAVENGAPDDWKLLTKQAEYLIKKDAGLATAKEWLDQSMEIKTNSYNLEVMGDYYAKCHLPKEAANYYIKSIDARKAELKDATADTSDIQDKLVALMK
ncbi:hypothetical protein [Reichenbachiella ulvae]|uniref:Tetratricopeptide repeat-containing protein n=1 Tax=Reichenbachiella ulvae TaxID=2980104 RepID=A0ABT3CWL2_9BACT|nr:hypothetical protein [Reichenbachiella ulvae]MCV9387613.1 hypothetical protein [Reichenbachiella ulvae]